MNKSNIFGGYSAQQLEVQYNKRAEVPDHEQYFLRWQDDSIHTRQNTDTKEDIAYGSSERETVDIFPASQAHAPVVVFIHGGYWQAMDKSYFSFIAPPLVERGFTVAVLNYPLCPAASLSSIVRSLRWAMIYLYRNIAHYNGDRDRFHLIGHSAGGHLTALLLATAWSNLDSALPASMLKSGIGVSGVYQLEPLHHTYLNQALNMSQAEIDELSPVNLPPPLAGKMALFVGGDESDEFKRQSKLFAQTWTNGGFYTRYDVLPGRNHFSILDELTDPSGAILNCLPAT